MTFFHGPQSRSTGVLILLEELGARYQLHVLNLKANEQRAPAYLAINPMGKVPAILHGDALVTEQVAIFPYLADLYPQAGLAPAIGDSLRGPYLRWLAMYGSCFEPAIIDRSRKHPAVAPSTSPYGDFDTLWKTLTDQLARGPFILGERFSAADVLWGTALSWITLFQLVPATPVVQDYIDRVGTRPTAVRARTKDAELAAAQH
jgi:glutathione S-transferase